ncbi:MAG TPA: carboxypeptidase-like regulatory domain-containing protein, partial [Gemmatimonas sp.]|nr:carboxypeptidase-like regulatory domain-containing protein [Gemmatimonas sp.]
MNHRAGLRDTILRARRGASVFLLLCVPAIVSAQGTPATGTVRGRITDAGNGRGLAEAQVSIVGTRIGAVSGANGEYTLLAVPAGTRDINVRRIGYSQVTRPVTVVAGGSATVDAALQVSAVNLSEVVVTGSAAPTERRKVGTSIASVD